MARIVGWMAALLIAGLIIVMVAGDGQAAHQTLTSRCAPRHVALYGLAARHGEASKGVGLYKVEHSTNIAELLVSTTGSWSFMVTDVDGRSCIIFSGMDWDDVPFKPGANP